MFERAARLLRRMTSMKTFSALFLLAVLLSGCSAGFRAGSAVTLGRQELFQGQNADALESFEVAARENPDFSFGIDRPEGVLSYLGRTQYLNGQYPQARQTLERDLARDQGNSLSRLYLGLTLVRLNDRQNGNELSGEEVADLERRHLAVLAEGFVQPREAAVPVIPSQNACCVVAVLKGQHQSDRRSFAGGAGTIGR